MMSTIALLKTVTVFMIKAVLYGCGLCLGFWIMGIITGYADHFIYKILDSVRKTPVPSIPENTKKEPTTNTNTTTTTTITAPAPA